MASHAARRERFVRGMIALNLVALVAAYMSGQWDAAEHAKGAVDREFWYPPHYGIYLGIFGAAVFSGLGLLVLLRAPGPLGRKVRANTALAAIVVANAIGFTGAPFDAWWHIQFGIDLSVWSPPHIHLLFGLTLAALAGAVYYLDPEPADAPLRPLRALRGRPTMASLAIVLALLLAAYLFFEYEAALPNGEVLARPVWTYPVLWTAFATFAVALPVAATRVRGTATFVAATFLLARLAVLAVDRLTLGFRGAIPYPILVPALVFDVALATAWPRWGTRRPWTTVAASGVLAAVSVAVTAPLFWTALDVVPALNAEPWTVFWPGALAAGTVGALSGWWCGSALRRLRPASLREPAAPVETP